MHFLASSLLYSLEVILYPNWSIQHPPYGTFKTNNFIAHLKFEINQATMVHPNIPSQSFGGFHDTVSMFFSESLEVANEYYKILEARIKAVNVWETYSDQVKAGFALLGVGTCESTADLEIGNFIRIDIPGIGNPSGGGYDWTKIVEIQKGDDADYPFFLFTVKPCSAFGEPEQPIAHFYTEDASNTFIVRKVGTCIYAEVHGRNELENSTNGPLIDNLRNKAVAVGSKLGLGNLNWLGFTESLVKPFQQQKPHN